MNSPTGCDKPAYPKHALIERGHEPIDSKQCSCFVPIMQWGRTHEPCRQTALRQAQYAYTKYIEGTEKAYLVEGAIADLIAAYDIESLDAIIYARLSLKEEDEGEKQRLMAIALKDVLTRRKVW